VSGARVAAILDLELDLPLADTPASRILAWIAAGLVGLAVLALALAAAADSAAWRAAQEPIMVTVALPNRAEQPFTDLELGTVTQALRRLPGVAQVRVLAAQDVGRLVQPWLGTDATLSGLPLPCLIEIAYEPGFRPDPTMLPAELATAAPGATIDPETADAPHLDRAARVLRDVSLGAAGLIFMAMAVVVAAVTRMSLNLHQATVDLLRLMGASEDHVGRQFEQHALANVLRGGLSGFTAAILLLAAAITVLSLCPVPGLPDPELHLRDWLLLGCVPVVGALLTALVARRTARGGLRRIG
jgi:cell division transport system permease protein